MRKLGYIVLVMYFAVSAAGCSDKDGGPTETESPRVLPTNLCGTIPAEVVSRWSLGRGAPSVMRSQDRASAGCEVSGTYLGTDLTLKLSLLSYGGKDVQVARHRMSHAVSRACSALRAAGGVSGEGSDCTAEKPGIGVTRVARAVPVHGMARVEVDYTGSNLKAVSADVEAILTELTVNSPDQMAR